MVIVKTEVEQKGGWGFCDHSSFWKPLFSVNRKSAVTARTTMTIVEYQGLKKTFTMTTYYDQRPFAMTKREKHEHFV